MYSYRFKAEPTPTQEDWAARSAGSNRWVYNEARKFCIQEYAKGNKYPGYPALCKKLTEWRSERSWLREGVCDAQQQALVDLDSAFQRFFKKLGKFPAKKSRKRSAPSMRFPQGSKIELTKLSKKDSVLKLPKLGQLRFRQSQPVLGTIRSVNLKRDSTREWHVVVLTDHVKRLPAATADQVGKAVGIDMGVKTSATLSNGTSFHVPVPSNQDEKHLARLQRRVARRKNGSRRCNKARLAVAKFHKRWQNRRNDILHKQSTRITLENQEVYVEALQVRNMTRKCRGKGRAAKAGLNKSILQQGWGMFHEMLEYKAARREGNVFGKENPAYSSQKCRKCGHTEADNRLTQAVFCCLKCNHTENADANASINILVAGQATTARGRSVRPVVESTSVRSRLAGRLKREPVGSACASST